VSAQVSATQQPQELRHEIKFVGHAIHYNRLRNWLRDHRERFIVPYPTRRINNVYFDDFSYRAYAQNLAGVSERSKLRHRWYGESSFPGKGVLEVKRKRNLFGWKERFDVSGEGWSEAGSWKEIVASIRAELPFNGRLWLDQSPLPVILNSYRREYFVSSDGAIRATIDTDQRVWDQRFARKPNTQRAAVLENTVVVEFKFPRSERARASRMIQDFPLRVGRHSKFMNGMRAVGFV
jgi:hypothetical protein